MSAFAGSLKWTSVVLAWVKLVPTLLVWVKYVWGVGCGVWGVRWYQWRKCGPFLCLKQSSNCTSANEDVTHKHKKLKSVNETENDSSSDSSMLNKAKAKKQKVYFWNKSLLCFLVFFGTVASVLFCLVFLELCLVLYSIRRRRRRRRRETRLKQWIPIAPQDKNLNQRTLHLQHKDLNHPMSSKSLEVESVPATTAQV